MGIAHRRSPSVGGAGFFSFFSFFLFFTFLILFIFSAFTNLLKMKTNMELIIIICASTVMGLFAGVNGKHQQANYRKQAASHQKEVAVYHKQADGHNKQLAVYHKQADVHHQQSEEEILTDMDEDADFERAVADFKLDRNSNLQADAEPGQQRQHVPVGTIIKVAIPVLKVGSNIMVESIIAIVNKIFGKAKCEDGEEDSNGKGNKFRCVSEELWKYIKKYFINNPDQLKNLFMRHHFMHTRRFLMLDRYMEKKSKN